MNETTQIKRINGSWYRDEEFQDFEEGMSANFKIFFDQREREKVTKQKHIKRLHENGQKDWALMNVLLFMSLEKVLELI